MQGKVAGPSPISITSDSIRFGVAMLAAQQRNRRLRSFALGALLVAVGFAITLVTYS